MLYIIGNGFDIKHGKLIGNILKKSYNCKGRYYMMETKINLLSKEEKKVLLWSLFIFIILIPVLLNFLLPIKTGLVILGEPSEWLMFWASYLAAVGSFTMALVSLWMNKRLHQHNDKTLNYVRWDKMVDRYNRIEKFVYEEEKMHSELVLRCILSYIEKHSLSDIRHLICHKTQELKSCSLRIARFVEQEKARDYNTETGRILNTYGACVQNVNKNISYSFEIAIKEDSSEKEWIDGIKRLIDDNHLILDKLENLRMDYLLAEKKRILKFAEDNHLEVYL